LFTAPSSLPPGEREALLLVTWEQLPHAEAAKVLGCSVAIGLPGAASPAPAASAQAAADRCSSGLMHFGGQVGIQSCQTEAGLRFVPGQDLLGIAGEGLDLGVEHALPQPGGPACRVVPGSPAAAAGVLVGVEEGGTVLDVSQQRAADAEKAGGGEPAIAGSGWQITLSQSCTAISCESCQARFSGCQSPCPITGSPR
jgi:hypothetical protein